MPASESYTMPLAFVKNETTATDTYACFVTEPWEKGFGHTIGNALRRVILSSIEGAAVSSLRIDGVPHEFTTIPDVVEDVTEIVLNIKGLHLVCDGETPRTLHLYADKAGPVTAADIRRDSVTTIINPELHICTLDRDRPLHMEIEIDHGRGYRPAEENKSEEQAIGVIPVDSLFSPITRVRYDVKPCRVGNRTDYDRLELEIWSDGRAAPETALVQSAQLLKEHLAVFAPEEEEEEAAYVATNEDRELLEKLTHRVSDLDLSVRAKNCLTNAQATFVGDLVARPEAELLKYRNFGRKSLEEIKAKLGEMDLSLGMDIKEEVRSAFHEAIEPQEEE